MSALIPVSPLTAKIEFSDPVVSSPRGGQVSRMRTISEEPSSGAGEIEVSEQLAEYLEKIREGIRLQGVRLNEQKLEDTGGQDKKDRDLADKVKEKGKSKRKSVLSGLTGKSKDAVSHVRAKGRRFSFRFSSTKGKEEEDPSSSSTTGERSSTFSSHSLHALPLVADSSGGESLFKMSEADDGGEDVALLSTMYPVSTSSVHPYRGHGKSQIRKSLDLAHKMAAKHAGHLKDVSMHLLRVRRREAGWSKIDG